VRTVSAAVVPKRGWPLSATPLLSRKYPEMGMLNVGPRRRQAAPPRGAVFGAGKTGEKRMWSLQLRFFLGFDFAHPRIEAARELMSSRNSKDGDGHLASRFFRYRPKYRTFV
jgi:hypothetical protein